MRWIPISSLVFLMACSGGDLSVKTDLDETYSVKDSAVTVKPIDDWPKHRAEIAEIARKTRSIKKEYDDYINRQKNLGGYDDAIEMLRSDRYKKVSISPEVFEDSFLNKYPDVLIPYVEIKFRAVFQDLNGDKKPTSYKKLTCYSPATDYILFKSDIKDKSSAFWQLALKVCNKYADLGKVKSLSIVDY